MCPSPVHAKKCNKKNNFGNISLPTVLPYIEELVNSDGSLSFNRQKKGLSSDIYGAIITNQNSLEDD